MACGERWSISVAAMLVRQVAHIPRVNHEHGPNAGAWAISMRRRHRRPWRNCGLGFWAAKVTCAGHRAIDYLDGLMDHLGISITPCEPWPRSDDLDVPVHHGQLFGVYSAVLTKFQVGFGAKFKPGQIVVMLSHP